MFWWILLLIATIALFVAAHVLLPFFILKPHYTCADVKDRGSKIIEEENGRSILYEPEINTRKYIKQYILSERNGKKLFTCRIDDAIRFIDFDLVLFNVEGKPFKTLNVKEVIGKAGYTQITLLPADTVYVTIMLNAVDGVAFPRRASGGISKKRLLVYLAFCAAVDIVGVILFKMSFAEIFGGIFGESFLALGGSWLWTAVICAAIFAVNAAFAIIALFVFGEKPGKGEEKYD